MANPAKEKVWLGKLTMLYMTLMGRLGSKTSNKRQIQGLQDPSLAT